MTFLLLFYEFFKIGLFAIGGGTATIPFLYDLAESDYGWFSSTKLTDMIAISESTPGPIGINMATFAGYNAGFGELGFLGGVLGGAVATVGLILPSLIIILIIAKFLQSFKDNKIVKNTFYGIRPCVAALVAFAVFGIFKITIFTVDKLNIPVLIIIAIAFSLMFIKQLKKLHPVIWILAGAVIGIIFKL
ncbi:MAG: chromate transporter [Clostridia bacterium]|nr:chromate transporter [Clostridia bacterium]